jgi:hypothetical protein
VYAEYIGNQPQEKDMEFKFELDKVKALVCAAVLAFPLAYVMVWGVSQTVPHAPVYQRVHNGIDVVYFPAPHTERAYFLNLAKELES